MVARMPSHHITRWSLPDSVFGEECSSNQFRPENVTHWEQNRPFSVVQAGPRFQPLVKALGEGRYPRDTCHHPDSHGAAQNVV